MRKLQRFKKTAMLSIVTALTLTATACGGSGEPGAGSEKDTATAGKKSEPVTLKMYMANTSDTAYMPEVNRKFEEKNPGIKIELQTAPVDQFQTVIKTKLASGDAPDIFTVFAGTKKDSFVKAGYLMDLSDQPWVSRLTDAAKEVSSKDGKVYGFPNRQNTIGVIYNKKIFKDLGLAVPTNWDEFLAACQKIKDGGIIPLGLGLKDQFVTQLIPYAMAPSAIYRDDPNFDKNMYAGKQTFTGSPWEQMMQDYIGLNEKGYFNKDSLGTSNDQVQQMVSAEKIAMTVTLHGRIAAIKEANPNIELGMFPLPYVKAGEKIWVSSLPTIYGAIYAKTKHPVEAKKYFEFLAAPDIAQTILTSVNSFSVFKDVNADLDPAVKDMADGLKVGSYSFLDAVWPSTVQPVMFQQIQNVFAGRKISDMISTMDKAFKDGATQQ
ncbi:ABC transporter substrate-binding protein [Paenibacillus periandrae]|uniref:ABC transporter substrate-binding protein n=1 Tax=Paenibacillus periandrae TaxID=1761741 RepID=UPI001F097C90|nr:extracellular solute-binding protein [Paenibacillus periandrae]